MSIDITSLLPDYLKDLPYSNYGMWDSPQPGLLPSGKVQAGEGGVDVGAPQGVPVIAISSGTVIDEGYWKDQQHGVVTVRTNVPGVGPEDLYYQHINIDPSIQTGMIITKGQQIGTVGSYNETELGFNAQWGSPWGFNHPGPWVSDPRPWLYALVGGSAADTAYAQQGGFGLPNIHQAINDWINGWVNANIIPTVNRIIFMTMGLTLIGVGVLVATKGGGRVRKVLLP